MNESVSCPAILPPRKKVAGLVPGPGAYAEFACLPCVCIISAKYSGFILQSKELHIRRNGNFELSVGVSLSANGHAFLPTFTLSQGQAPAPLSAG